MLQHPPDGAAGAGPDVPFGDGSRRRGFAGLVGRLGIRPDAGVSHREIVDDGADHDRDAQAAGRPPVEADLPVLMEPHGAGHRAEAPDAAAREQNRVDAVDGADGLQQDHQRLAGRRSVVVDGRRRRFVEEDRRAAGRPPRIGEVADLETGNVGDRARRRGRVGALARVSGSRRRGHGAPERRGKLTPSHISSIPAG